MLGALQFTCHMQVQILPILAHTMLSNQHQILAKYLEVESVINIFVAVNTTIATSSPFSSVSTSDVHFIQPLFGGYHCSVWNRPAGAAWHSRKDFAVI
jgi:hypothetical protein